MHPKIIIHHTKNINEEIFGIRQEKIHCAAIVILSDGKHFRCIKNRWGLAARDEKIPLFLLVPYLKQYEQRFTKEDLFAALAYETTS